MNNYQEPEIKKGIPVPNALGRNSIYTKYPYGKLEVGDCFDTRVEDPKKGRQVRTSIAANARMWAKRNDESRRFCTRELVDEQGVFIRIWRWC